MKNSLFASIICLVISSNASANSNFTRCLFNSNPQIRFMSSLGKLEYDFSKNTSEVSEVSKKPALGLAQRRLGYAVFVDYKHVKHGKGWCIAPKTVDVFIGIAKPIIYVSNEYPPETCMYKFILRHEQAHMQTTIRMLEHFVKLAPKRMKMAGRDIKPIYIKDASDANRAAQAIYEEYAKIVILLTRKLEEETEIEQTKIDDPKVNTLRYEVCGKFDKKF